MTSAAIAATARLLRRADNWWLHVDLDVLSTDALPAVDYPQPGGLRWSELEALTAAALRAPGCLGMTLCIYNPDLDPAARTPTASWITSVSSAPANSTRADSVLTETRCP